MIKLKRLLEQPVLDRKNAAKSMTEDKANGSGRLYTVKTKSGQEKQGTLEKIANAYKMKMKSPYIDAEKQLTSKGEEFIISQSKKDQPGDPIVSITKSSVSNELTQDSYNKAMRLAARTVAWWKSGGGGDALKKLADTKTSFGDDEVWFAIQYNQYCQKQLKDSGLKKGDPYYHLMKAWLIGKNQIIGKKYTRTEWYYGNGDKLAGQESIDVELDPDTLKVIGNPYSICAEIDDGWAVFGGQDDVFLILPDPDGNRHYYSVDPEI